MHDEWDPVMLNVYLQGLAQPSSRPEAAADEAAIRRRSVSSRTLTLLAQDDPLVDVRRENPVIDISFG